MARCYPRYGSLKNQKNMEQTKNAIASASNINVLSTFTQESLNSMMDAVRRTELRGYSKAQQDDMLGDALLHLCEKASNGYFSSVDSLSGVKALSFTIMKRKAGDVRDKVKTFRKHVDIDPKDISDMFDGEFDLTEDVDDYEDQKDTMNRFIKALPGKEGDVLRMTHEGYSDDEIVADLQMTRNSVQKTRSTARSKVIRFMKSSEYGRSNSSSETRPSAEADASADFFCTSGKNPHVIPLIIVNKTKRTMKNTYASEDKRKNHSVSKSISEERLDFKGGILLGDLSIAIESGSTKRKVRRILEKRVNQDYWSHVRNSQVRDNRYRASSKKYVSSVTRKIFGGPVTGYEYWT